MRLLFASVIVSDRERMLLAEYGHPAPMTTLSCS